MTTAAPSGAADPVEACAPGVRSSWATAWGAGSAGGAGASARNDGRGDSAADGLVGFCARSAVGAGIEERAAAADKQTARMIVVMRKRPISSSPVGRLFCRHFRQREDTSVAGALRGHDDGASQTRSGRTNDGGGACGGEASINHKGAESPAHWPEPSPARTATLAKPNKPGTRCGSGARESNVVNWSVAASAQQQVFVQALLEGVFAGVDW